MNSPRIVTHLQPDSAAEREAVVAALRAEHASIAPKYFYDELGCALYGAICRLPEYYPTRTEVSLFQARRLDMAEQIGQGRQFVDLGAGDCCKAKAWIPFLAPSRYVAVDFAVEEITGALTRMVPDFPGLECVGLATDFSKSLQLEEVLDSSPALFFYPGSSIGNFAPAEATAFLAGIRRHCADRPGSSLLIGVDGKKDKQVLDSAYADSLGVTAAFNRNALRHLNRKFGFDFDVDAFGHVAFYNEAEGRIEMHLQSLNDQTVLVGGRKRHFAKDERIHTENSYKYDAAEFEAMLAAAGFTRIRRWESPEVAYFVFQAT